MRPNLTLIPLALSLMLGPISSAHARGYDVEAAGAAALIFSAEEVSSLISNGTLQRLRYSPSR